MGLFKSLTGMVEVAVTSADIGSALQRIASSDIHIYGTQQKDDLTVVFTIKHTDLKKAEAISAKRGEKVTIKSRRGLYWSGRRMLKRRLLLFGIIFLLGLACFLPTRIFFVQVEGNVSIPTRRILSEAEACGIAFGASRRAVRSEKMKNALLSSIPELQWAGLNTKGCVAVISVREKTTHDEIMADDVVSGIVASRDGVIIGCTVESGNPLCTVGQAVREGELLVSGFTDCGISIRATRAVGEVYAQTDRTLQAITPLEYTFRGKIKRTEKKYALLIGKKRINFYKNSGIPGAVYDKMSEGKVLTLPGGFQLPVTIITERWVSYEEAPGSISPEAAQELLENFAQVYLKQQMIAGSILGKTERLASENGNFMLTGQYACCEMIGREQFVEIMK